jgi:hypothetical protein
VALGFGLWGLVGRRGSLGATKFRTLKAQRSKVLFAKLQRFRRLYFRLHLFCCRRWQQSIHAQIDRQARVVIHKVVRDRLRHA